MKAGDLIEWEWNLGTGWEPTRFTGVILRKIHFTDRHGENHFMFKVMSSDGVVEIRDDLTLLRVLSRHANEDSPVV
jgi:hypothetical protein